MPRLSTPSRWQRFTQSFRFGHWLGWSAAIAGLALMGAGIAIDMLRSARTSEAQRHHHLQLMADARAAAIAERLAQLGALLDRFERALAANPADALLITTTMAGLDPGIGAALVLDGAGRTLASSRAEQMQQSFGGDPALWAALATTDVDPRLVLHREPGGSGDWTVARQRRGAETGVLMLQLVPGYFDPQLTVGDGAVGLTIDQRALVDIADGGMTAERTLEPAVLAGRLTVRVSQPAGAATLGAFVGSLSAWALGLLLALAVAFVSSLRRAELRRLRGLHQRLLQRNDEGLVGIGPDGLVRFANAAFSAQVGQPPGALLGVDVNSLLHWDEPQSDAIQSVLSGAEARREGLAAVQVGGDLLRVVVTAARENGELSGALLAFSDPVRGPASPHQAPTERLYRTLFDLSPDGVIIVDLDSEKPLAFNHAALHLLGLRAEELSAVRIRELEAAPAPAETIRQLVRVLASGRVEFATRYRRGAEVIDVAITAQTIEFASRPALYWIVRDVTGQQRARDELAANEALLRTLIDRLPLPLAVFEGRELSLVNARMLIDVGADAARARDVSGLLQALGATGAIGLLIEQRWNLLDDPDAELSDPIEVRVGGQAAEAAVFDLHLARVDTRTLMMLVDLSSRDRSEQGLVEAMRLAERANRARSEFLANMSHEIRTPMTAILGLAHLLQRSSLAATQRDYTQKIDSAARTLLSILDDLLDYAKLETGRLSIELEAFSLRALIRELEVVYQDAAKEKGLRLRFDVAGTARDALIGDAVRLRQVLLNLIGNALKFTERGHVHVSVRPAEGDFLLFDVEDSGIGISVEQQQRIFEAFYQGEGSAARRFGGTGLGLPITHALVQLMGGTLDVKSELHVGSVFTVKIELASADQPVPEAQSAALPAGVPRLHRMRILLVEDHPINRHVVSEILRVEGAEVAAAAIAKDALQLLETQTFDAVLMDIQMPEMDGHEATRAIRRRFTAEQLPVVAMTANASAEDRALSHAAGMNAHLAKPIDVNALVATLVALAGRLAPPIVEPAATGDGDAPVLDADKALQRLGGNRALYAQMAGLFAREQTEAPAQLQDAIDAGQRDEAMAQAHKLKGVAATLGAEALADKAKQLERALKRQKPANEVALLMSELHAEFAQATAALRSAADMLRPAPEERTGVSLADFDAAQFENRLDALVLALVDSDMAALDVYAELSELAPEPLIVALQPVEDALRRLDFNAALNGCRGVEKALERLAGGSA